MNDIGEMERLRIPVVDDGSSIRMMLAAGMSNAGYHMLVAGSAVTAAASA
jgi:CheY-like chemotaxis protein